MVSGTWLPAVRTWGADIAFLVTVTLGRAWSEADADADADVGVDGEADADADADVEAAVLVRVTLGFSRLVGGWVDTFGFVGCTQSAPVSLGGEKIRAGYAFQYVSISDTFFHKNQGGTIL